LKAAILESRQNIKFINLPESDIENDEVKIRVYACGICGSDVHEYKYGPLFWMPSGIGGHEFGGQIIEKGDAVAHLDIGDSVVVKLGYECNECYYCKNGNSHLCIRNNTNLLAKGGGFAEYSVVSDRQVVKLPNDFSIVKVVLVEPLAVAIHALKKIDISTNDYILIIGSGAISLLLARWLKKCNPECKLILVCKYNYIASLAVHDCIVVDLRVPDKLKFISEMRIRYAFDCAGNRESFALAYNLIMKGGKVIIVSIFSSQVNLNLSDLMFNEKVIDGSFLYSHREFIQSIEALKSDEIDCSRIISGRFPLSEITRGFEELLYNKDNHLKVIVYPE
jgi:threonine dehydrogenase-like Zn-dependent dehydrogenase